MRKKGGVYMVTIDTILLIVIAIELALIYTKLKR
jgi:hypothetical protein